MMSIEEENLSEKLSVVSSLVNLAMSASSMDTTTNISRDALKLAFTILLSTVIEDDEEDG